VHRLLACSCLTPILLAPAILHAETTVTDKRTTGIATSTIKGGARDDLRITSTGSVELTGGTAVTLDTVNIASNEGTILIKDASNATGILAAAASGEIKSSGKITIDETYAPADGDKDGDLDGPFSKQSGNAGIRMSGAFTGAVTHSGAIAVKGNNSTGILLGGPLTGTLAHSGTIDVIGDGATGIRADAVNGSVKIFGNVNVQGQGATAVSIDGAISGSLAIQSAIASTGYRTTAAPADPAKLEAEDLLQGGPAVRIAASVNGGIIFDVRPKDNSTTDNDEDDDGIEDAKEGNASIASYGAAPAVLVGSASSPVAIGQVSSTDGVGLLIRGEALGAGVHKGIEAAGMQIGGLGGTVSVAGGIGISGKVGAVSVDANATALRIGAGASVPRLTNSGTIAAASAVGTGGQVSAVSIDGGASLPAIANSGAIQASTTGEGNASAIRDRSGTLLLVENSGAILAQSKKVAVENAVAIDLSASNTGATVRQLAVASGVSAPRIAGSILFGSGSDLLDLADGSVAGTTRFGAGANRLQMSGDAAYSGDAVFGSGGDTLALAGTSSFQGGLDFGGGADTLNIGGTARLSASLANASGLAVTMTGGTFEARNTGPVQIASLTLSGTSTLGVTVDPTTKTATQLQVGSATFGAGSKVAVAVTRVGAAEGSYVIVKAGSLTGAGNLTASDTALPYMFKASVTANQAAGEVNLQVSRKSVAELGLSRSQVAAYNGVFAALDQDAKVAGIFLGISGQEAFRDAVQQMLPEHAGGLFETVTRGERAIGAYIADPNAMVAELDGLGFWLQQVGWGTAKARGETAAYRTSGWGASGGVEHEIGIGKVGLSLAFLNGRDTQRGLGHRVDVNQYSAAFHWRNNWGGFNAFLRGSAAMLNMDGSRVFTGALGSETVTRTATGDWDGHLYAASAGLSYQLRSGRLTIRPSVTADYHRLREDAHAEAGGGDAFNLSVASRTSDEMAVNGSLAAGYDLHSGPGGSFMRLELEGGRREIVGGSLGVTVARFKNGTDFTLLPEERQAGWTGALRLVGGREGFRAGGEAVVEEQNGRAAMRFRATLSFGF
jgi:hypothetical protein